MNKRQLRAIGVPEDCVKAAQASIVRAANSDRLTGKKPDAWIAEVLASPQLFVTDEDFGELARELTAAPVVRPKKAPAHYKVWGDDIDDASRAQMNAACQLPVSVAGALMPDAHVGYGLPIGGVLATAGAVVPYAVGVDIACRMKLSITDLPVSAFDKQPQLLDTALEKGTQFGIGSRWKSRQQHDVFDQDWSATGWLKNLKDLAWEQLGSSGSGNHFVEWGVVTFTSPDLGLEVGSYTALLSHSGSRGAGAKTCDYYSRLATRQLPKEYEEMKHLAWLDLDSEVGQEYWLAMNMMGDYASANHAVIHKNVLKLAGAHAITGVENHHNFAWMERHRGQDVIVHRKGATPAGEGVLGVIPGNMADSCYVVRGKGSGESLHSASHGAGRCMSRTEAKKRFNWSQWRKEIADRGVRLLAAGLDEVPGVYKDIRTVMAAQSDLVDVVATFQPKIVMMCGDDSRAED